MFFRLKDRCGFHTQNGKKYKSGDVIETEMDLCAKFAGKFELLHQTDVEDTGVESKPNITTPTGKDEDVIEKSQSESLSGTSSEENKSKKESAKSKDSKDVTDQFTAAKDIGVLVFEKKKSNGKWYSIYDPDDKKILNKKNLRKKQVNDFIASITEEDDEE